MIPTSNTTLCVPALGRPFHLGMLYDCRNDQLIQGITLWDKSTLEEKVVQPHETSDFSIITNDSLEDKASALEIGANLKLSFLGDLLDVSGSGKYLQNRKSSNKQERVTLQYKCTTKLETMTMEQLGQSKVQHPGVFNHGTGTHVVTGILYGAQAFFVLEKDRSSSSHTKEVDGDLHCMVKKIPFLKIKSKVNMDMSESENEKVENFTCKFNGDFRLPENPCSYQDAVRIYEELPKLLGEEGEKAVPIKVTLYPLALLDDRASRLVRDIKANLTCKIEEVFEEFHELIVRCNDLYNSSVLKEISAFQKEISKFKSLITTHKCELKRQLSVLLPNIRGGGVEESHLADLLRKNETSPFSYHELDTWVQDKEKLVKLVNEYTKTLSEIKCATKPGDLESLILSPENDYILCFRILLPQNSSHLTKMEMYNRNEYDPESNHIDNKKNLDDTSSKNCMDDNMSMMEKTVLFRNYFVSNKGRSGLAFAMAVDFSNTLNCQAHIQCYRRGRLICENYELPSAPGMPHADTEESTHNSITIYWTAPEYGASTVQKYEISCQQANTDRLTVSFTTGPDARSFIIPNLEANCAYQVRVRSRCETGEGPTSDTATVYTRPTSPPGKPQVWQISPTTAEIQWSKPLCIASQCNIHHYILTQLEEKSNKWITVATINADELSYRAEVTANDVPKFKVAAHCGAAGCSVDSDPSDHMSVQTENGIIKSENSKILKEKLCAASNNVHVGTPCIYTLQPKLVICKDEDLIRKYEIGTPTHNVKEKVILLVGARGSGKTTLINGIINHIYGVNWKDDFRFKLISDNNTDSITFYTIHHQEDSNYPHTLTIIDTPGFGDTSGVMRDKQIINQLYKLFTTKGTGGIDHIDGVGLVVQSSLPRLTPAHTFFFDQILSLFGKTFKDNIFLLLTFADGQQPQVLSGIKEAGIPYKKCFKFNNSALFASNSEVVRSSATEDESYEKEINCNFDEMFWQMGETNFNAFLKQLNVAVSRNLFLTNYVHNEQGQLQIYIAGKHSEILAGLNALAKLEKEKAVVYMHRTDIDNNNNLTYTVKEEVCIQVEIPPGQYITKCQLCNRTCQENFPLADDTTKYNCWATTNTDCFVCPQKCNRSMHKNFPFKDVYQMVQRNKTTDELRKRYQKAQQSLPAEHLYLEIQDEFNSLQLEVLETIESVKKSLERLSEIALKPNPLSSVEYIDIMIDSEKSQAQPGWQRRVEQLELLRKVEDKEFGSLENISFMEI
ncbi:uncharacterized protein [Cherax quadricarinatus]|uniref:uncharacterized protein n=1 Tax=Cherax quadricarinatus TaxID=27406 RepID=UPI00387E5E84